MTELERVAWLRPIGDSPIEISAVIKHALEYFDSDIRSREYQRAICEVNGQKIYVANLTAQIKTLESYKAALVRLGQTTSQKAGDQHND